MSAHIFTVNSGSSSIKFSLFEAPTLNCVAVGQIDGLGTDPELRVKDSTGATILVDSLEGDRARDHAGALQVVLSVVARKFPGLPVAAVGHRFAHGGLDYSAPVLLDETHLANLARLNRLAPLHQPHNLAGVAAAQAALPGTPQVACFDTAFHRGQAFVHEAFAIPRSLYDQGVRRYGFHGLSCEYVTNRLAEIAPREAHGRVVICHLGSGASMCATRSGRSVTSTMGFSPLDGLPMGTRPGRIDPGVLLYLIDQGRLDAEALTDLLYRRSGLLGLSGVSNDMRTLEQSSDPRAREAIDYFVTSVRRELGAMAAALGGLDAIVFCGGIGENARSVRAAVLDGMQWLGIELDVDRNADNAVEISEDHSRVRVFVVPTDEERVIAKHTARVALETRQPMAA